MILPPRRIDQPSGWQGPGTYLVGFSVHLAAGQAAKLVRKGTGEVILAYATMASEPVWRTHYLSCDKPEDLDLELIVEQAVTPL